MPPCYHHLTIDEREQLVVRQAHGWSVRRIAKALHRDPTTRSRELRESSETTTTQWRCGGSPRLAAQISPRLGVGALVKVHLVGGLGQQGCKKQHGEPRQDSACKQTKNFHGSL